MNPRKSEPLVSVALSERVAEWMRANGIDQIQDDQNRYEQEWRVILSAVEPVKVPKGRRYRLPLTVGAARALIGELVLLAEGQAGLTAKGRSISPKVLRDAAGQIEKVVNE